MTEIAIRQPAEVAVATEIDVDSWASVVGEISRLADVICGTSFVPKAYRDDAPAVMAAILAGRELGLPPMTALRHVQLVEGAASLSAEYKRARVLAAGHEFDVLEATTTRCTVSGRRRGSHKPPLVITFTIEDARTARLIKDRGAWTTRPRRMLFARAGTELCDFVFPDITNGLPTTELLEQDDDGGSGYDEQPAPRGRVTAAEITARHSTPPNVSPAEKAPPALPAEPAGEAPDPGPAAPDETRVSGPTAGPDPIAPGASSSVRAPGSASQQKTSAPSPSSPGSSASEPGDTGYDSPFDAPGTVLTTQLTAIWTVMSTVYGFTKDEKEQARAVCAHIIGRPLESTKGMSKNEAKGVLDTLASWRETADREGSAPRDYLVSVMAAEAAGDE